MYGAAHSIKMPPVVGSIEVAMLGMARGAVLDLIQENSES